MKYLKRIADAILQDKLAYSGAVQITGLKFCGKTETAKQQAKSLVNMQADPSVATAMAADPRILLMGETPRLIDEWQEYPAIKNVVRREVDERGGRNAQFILTGSATPNDETQSGLHSGAGRVSRMRMRTMTWLEMGWSDGGTSLAKLLDGENAPTSSVELEIPEVLRRIAIGGFPAQVGDSEKIALKKNRDYVSNVVESDIQRVTKVSRDPVKVRKIFESYARNIATPAKVATIISDTSGALEQTEIDRATVNAYLSDLARVMVIDDLPAWNTHIRSSAKLRQTPKRHFADPCLAVAALNLSSELLMKELNYAGFLFESQVVHDLRIYAEALDATVYYYLDTDGDEVDLIIERADGKFSAFEVKLGIGAAEEAVQSLSTFRSKLTDKRQADLISLNVVTGSGLSYARPDGINVISLASLGV
jgi:predicted AAA+ superfamily ATPase